MRKLETLASAPGLLYFGTARRHKEPSALQMISKTCGFACFPCLSGVVSGTPPVHLRGGRGGGKSQLWPQRVTAVTFRHDFWHMRTTPLWPMFWPHCAGTSGQWYAPSTADSGGIISSFCPFGLQGRPSSSQSCLKGLLERQRISKWRPRVSQID